MEVESRLHLSLLGSKVGGSSSSPVATTLSGKMEHPGGLSQTTRRGGGK